ncbi:branched-chain amino acid ABC transporter permease/ATP-binding protein [Streptomyces sp. DSM 41524]|uniref:Branched-chain amino acid ABC transporter permease/ATP-binding protein n=1 Tax=Streptomyces asiaticus subsp. ignotus TaxID=3098222 RepID=A0ABU7Q611_9ACTN|nr:branched-chain amino acid ABC transporter permease/ATP-binding protein [Streptomyces sp. DSM 41524]
MSAVLGVAVLGLGLSALYALASLGIVLIYRGSGVINFAQGAVGLCAAYIWFELHINQGWGYPAALLIAVAAAAAVGALIHIGLMRQLKSASSLARTIATLGLLISLQALVILRYGTNVNVVPSALPTGAWTIGDVTFPQDRVILISIAFALSAGLWWMYRFTDFGRATSAVAEDQTLSAAVGVSPDVVATVNWALGCGLAALAAILVAPIITLQASSMTTLVLAALAAALIAQFRSFPVAFIASVALGVGQTILTRYTTQPGLAAAAPFLVIVVVMIVRGQAVPLRDHVLARLPAVGTGRLRAPLVLAGVVGTIVLANVSSDAWTQSFGATFALSLFMLSFVVLIGYVGQISLAQWPLAGFGAWVAGRLGASQGMPLLPAIVIGILATVALGVVIALPALRARGIKLAIVTLGLGTALELMLFQNSTYTGGLSGTAVQLEIAGWNFDAGTHPDRYLFVTFGAFVLAAIVVTNMRRGLVGRRMLAVRTNERAAAALGIGVRSVKLYGFAVAAGIAALGAILFSFAVGIVDYTEFSSFHSILYTCLAFVGGIGFVSGPLLGSPLAPGTVGTQFGTVVLSGVATYLSLIGGVVLILSVLLNQDGIAKDLATSVRQITSRLGPRHQPQQSTVRRQLADDSADGATRTRTRVRPSALAVDRLSVRYGNVVVVDDVSLAVRPGQVIGLIGPNGAGKTTLLDAVTGFTRVASGRVTLNDDDMTRCSPVFRARAGVSRAFQSLELFEDLTALENIVAATDPTSRSCYLRDLVHPAPLKFSAGVLDAIREFQLEQDLDRPASELPYGRRRLLAIARAVANGPSVLLLDEPAAGLSGEETRELATVVRRLARDWGMAVLLIEHDVEFVLETCDELVVLNFGRVISRGAPLEVRNDPAVVAAYLGGETKVPSPSKELRR